MRHTDGRQLAPREPADRCSKASVTQSSACLRRACLPGSHRSGTTISKFFNSPREEYDTLLPFICDGINCGQRAFHVLPSQHRDDHLGRLRDAGIDVEGAQRTRQLEVALPEDTYLRTGRFNKDAMLALIQEALKAGNALGFPLTRMIAQPKRRSTTGRAATNGSNTRCGSMTCCRTMTTP
jgi:MEDS: MEthanogen/methylotroph, DcmR Sensory domain